MAFVRLVVARIPIIFLGNKLNSGSVACMKLVTVERV